MPVGYLLLADAVAIALGLSLIYETVGLSGFGMMGYITIPIFTLICSLGLWMWANGAGANLVSSPGWNNLDEQQKVRAVSTMGLHLAIGMAVVVRYRSSSSPDGGWQRSLSYCLRVWASRSQASSGY